MFVIHTNSDRGKEKMEQSSVPDQLLNTVRLKEVHGKDDLRSFRVSLKQWRMLHAVVHCGSFSNAAEFLNVTQPAISYTIAKLEEQLGVSLLKLEGRKARITETGKVLLEKSKFLLREAIELEEFAENLKRGSGPEVRLAVGRDFPNRILIPAIRMFSLYTRDVKVRLIGIPMPEIDEVLRERGTDLAISDHIPPGFQGDLLIETEYLPVAHPDHALFAVRRKITRAELDREVEVVSNLEISERINRQTTGRRNGQLWNVSDFDTAEEALREGLGFGWLPRHRIQQSLDNGKLRILDLESGPAYKINFYLIHARPSSLSSAANRLAEILHSVAANRHEVSATG
jgi:DNA-binding transcriptional LysR family regulator